MENFLIIKNDNKKDLSADILILKQNTFEIRSGKKEYSFKQSETTWNWQVYPYIYYHKFQVD